MNPPPPRLVRNMPAPPPVLGGDVGGAGAGPGSCCGHKAEPHTVVPAPLMAQDRGMGPVSSPLTTHVLDTASGLPAQGLGLRLSRLEDHGQQWTELRTSYTDHDGRCPGLLPAGQMKAGTYKLSFDTAGYWKQRGQESFYPYVEVVFTIGNETHKFHVPLLLSPWSYTTYRGS
ncbi:5-hydroxyisourate hydrolase-like isoform X3 [Pteropus medius]|uniref:5-hydroxyisourate hydrolase-like isoform X3 n=1 Tax=Pteropus vampyrus TaxID=132908 RepID=UPI00196AF47D|nr:5-hydroxyisourate hydrolase-like isoform X3 [Pteropus giganteus]